MSGALDARPLYLDVGGAATFCVFHPAAEPATGVGVVLSPPFGYDEMCSHRSRRAWAQRLAANGHPVLRLDLPGTGDSDGTPSDPGLVDAWTDALGEAAGWLRHTTGCGRVVVIGLGLGGLLGWRAAARGAAIDDLVLWAVPGRGRAFVRELNAFSRLGIASPDAPEMQALDVPPLPAGSVEAGGFLLSAETVADLGRVDVSELPLPAGAGRRLLLIPRDGAAVDGRLSAAADASGADVTCRAVPGFTDVMDEPHKSRPPVEVFAAVDEWLAGSPTAPVVEPPAAPPELSRAFAELEVDGVPIRETPLAIPRAGGENIVGILAEPPEPAPLCAVLLNVGAERRIGPNRMWTELARRWAAAGVPAARLDLPGIGDGGGPVAPWGGDAWSLYEPQLVAQVQEALADLTQRGLGDRFLLVGLCSGAYWSFQAACEDEHVAAALLINTRLLIPDRARGSTREVRNLRGLLTLRGWRKLLTGRVGRRRRRAMLQAVGTVLLHLPSTLRGRVRAAATGGDALDHALDGLRDRDVAVRMLFSPGEPVYEELGRAGHLARMERWPNTRVELLPGPAKTHTLQLVRLERHVHARADAFLHEELARLRVGAHASRR